jgi:NAD(P)-dependent dehydrogenase (short-subunit alcohol dehydrogenase family)
MCPDYSVQAGLRMSVNELWAELGPYGIRVNAVSPGPEVAVERLSLVAHRQGGR